MKYSIFYLFTSICFVAFIAQAAPHPLTSSSIINNTQLALAFSQLGFTINSVPSGWIYKNADNDSSKSIEIGPSSLKLKNSISFRMDSVSKKTNLEQYVRQYLRDYNQYGFEVTNLQSNMKSDKPNIIVDLSQKNKQTKSRQFFYIENEKIIIASCVDTFADFSQSVTHCDRILNTFEWTKNF